MCDRVLYHNYICLFVTNQTGGKSVDGSRNPDALCWTHTFLRKKNAWDEDPSKMAAVQNVSPNVHAARLSAPAVGSVHVTEEWHPYYLVHEPAYFSQDDKVYFYN